MRFRWVMLLTIWTLISGPLLATYDPDRVGIDEAYPQPEGRASHLDDEQDHVPLQPMS